jgi:hypothetical protein
VSSSGGPLSSVRLTFDEAIAPSSFDGGDVVLKDAQGNAISPVTVTPVAGSGNTQFDLAFAGQSLRGTYRLTVGPNVTDASGNPMNQNQNTMNGEAADAYSGTVTFAPTVWTPASAPPVLYNEGFENWSSVPTYWSFDTQATGTIGMVTSGTPHGGTQQLLIHVVNDGNYRTESAVMAVDLSAYSTATDLNLDFWAKYANSQGYLYVDFSGDGAAWQQVASFSPSSTYTNYTLDLDALASGAGIARDADVYVRFRYYGNWSSGTTQDLYLDDVRVVKGDLTGPWVTAQSPTTVSSSGS